MEKDYILGGVADAHLFVGDNLYCNAITTLTDSGMNIQISAEDVRGGKGAALLGRYFHSSGMTLTLTNATFNLDYLAASVGGNIEGGAEVMFEEPINITGGAGVLTYDAKPMLGCSNVTQVWYKKAGSQDAYRTVDSVTGKNITITGGEGQYCVKYFYTNNAASTLTIKSDFVPKTLHLILDANLYAVGDTASAGQTNVGKIVIDVPAFQLNGNQDLTMNMTGTATINMEGTALAVSTCDDNCTGGKYYAKIVQVVTNAAWYDGIKNIFVDGGVVKQGADLALYATFDGKLPQKVTIDMMENLKIYLDNQAINGLTVPSEEAIGAKTLSLRKDAVELASGAVEVESKS